MPFFDTATSATATFSWRSSLLLSLCLPALAIAEVPVTNRDNPLLGAEGSYSLVHQENTWTLLIKTKGVAKPVSIDLSACLFCRGEAEDSEDIGDCQADGVFPLLIKQQAYVGVACHVGVHSHRVSIYAADRPDPVFTATGAYYSALSVFPAGIAVDYDRRLSGNKMKEERKYFPAGLAQTAPRSLPPENKTPLKTAQLIPGFVDLRAAPVDDAPILARMKQQEVYLHGQPTSTGWQFVSRKDGFFGYVLAKEIQP